MSRRHRRAAIRYRSRRPRKADSNNQNFSPIIIQQPPCAAELEFLEIRTLLSAAFDMVGLTALRADPTYSAINGQGIAVAVLDTGIYGEHPDLVNNVEVWFDAVKYGNQWATNKGDTNIADSSDPDGHGSNVAGIAASSNPDIGVATGAKIVDVRVLPADGEAMPELGSALNRPGVGAPESHPLQHPGREHVAGRSLRQRQHAAQLGRLQYGHPQPRKRRRGRRLRRGQRLYGL